jgi:beta-lactamase class A
MLRLFIILLIGLLGGCNSIITENSDSRTFQTNTGTDYTPIINKIKEIEAQLITHVGVAIYDVETDTLWSYKGNDRFPLMSTFKTLACAKALFDIENHKLSFDESIIIKKEMLITWSPITKKHIGEIFTLKQACTAMMKMSDNTAANIVLDKIGGPRALTDFMRSMGDNVTRLDRIEPELGEAIPGDKRDTTTPEAIVKSLHTLLFTPVLSEDYRNQLKQWMIDNKVSDTLFRSVLPAGWSIADRSGAGKHGSRGITALVWSGTHSPLIISTYLTQTEASFEERNKAIADIGKVIFSLYD